MAKILTESIRTLLLGFGQVMFCRNIISGILFLAGIAFAALCCESSFIVLAPLAGGAVSTLTGALLYGRTSTEDGLWGFNGVLIGCALSALPIEAGRATLWCLLIAGAALSPALKNMLDRLLSATGRNSLTMPFVLITWCAVLIFGTHAPESTPAACEASTVPTIAASLFKGISEVFLMDSAVSGMIFTAALAVCSPRTAILALAGASVGFLAASLAGASAQALSCGLYSFSPALTAIAVGTGFKRFGAGALLYTTLACAATVMIQLLMEIAGIIPLTAPFCIATWAARR